MPPDAPSTASPLTDDAAYAAMQARDARFDGRLFVGVTSTGIYCRPVCRVRLPRRENCRFFTSAARAEDQGFRPCLRCRPELAPGLSLTDSSQTLADQAARWLDDAAPQSADPAAADAPLLATLASHLGVTDRHLRRIFVERHGVSPIDYLTTRRLLLAKQLLTDTDWPVTQVALAAGFRSLRRFNAVFAERYRLSPSALRRDRGADAPRRSQRTAPLAESLSAPPALRLAFRPPYDLSGVLGFVARRALPGVEQVEPVGGGEIRRTLAVQVAPGQVLAGWVAMRFDAVRHEVHLRVAPTLQPALGILLPRVRQALDLDADPTAIDAALATLPGPSRPGVRVIGGLDPFETAARVILGQQVTVAAARTLTRRLVERFGTPVATPWLDVHTLFPSAACIAAAPPEQIGTLGIVRQRVRALQALAQALADGTLVFDRHRPIDAQIAALRELPGIGDWSAQLIAMRALAWPDAFPATDIGLLNALGTRDVAAVTAQAEAWRPWRAYAVLKLWLDLEDPCPTPC